MPHIGIKEAVDELQFVDIIFQAVLVLDAESFFFFESFRVPVINIAGAITNNQVTAIVGDSPSFAPVAEFPDFPERFYIVYKPFLILPGDLAPG